METPREVRLKLTLLGGQEHEVTLREDAPELGALFAGLATPQAGSRLVQLPMDDGNAAWSFQTSQIVSIVS